MSNGYVYRLYPLQSAVCCFKIQNTNDSIITDLQNVHEKILCTATNHFFWESADQNRYVKPGLEPQAQASEMSSQARAHFKPSSRLGWAWAWMGWAWQAQGLRPGPAHHYWWQHQAELWTHLDPVLAGADLCLAEGLCVFAAEHTHLELSLVTQLEDKFQDIHKCARMVLANLDSGTITESTAQTAVYVDLELELDDNDVQFWRKWVCALPDNSLICGSSPVVITGLCIYCFPNLV